MNIYSHTTMANYEIQNLQEAYAEIYSLDQTNLEEDSDIYDIILSHLLDEGYAESQEAAESIMVNMSEAWKYSIMEKKYGTKKGRHRLAMKIKRGEEIGKKNVPGKTGFRAVEAKAKKYGATNPAAVAAAAMWKKYGK